MMKKSILSILLLLGISCTLMAREPDETELTLMEKVKWCQLEGQMLYAQAAEQQIPPHAAKMYFEGAMKFFSLERQYMEDLHWHRFVADLVEAIRCDCCEDEDEECCDRAAMLSQVIKQFKANKP